MENFSRSPKYDPKHWAIVHCNPLQGHYRVKTGFTCEVFPHRENPVFITWNPCNENRLFSVRKNFTGKTLIPLQGWVCNVQIYLSYSVPFVAQAPLYKHTLPVREIFGQYVLLSMNYRAGDQSRFQSVMYFLEKKSVHRC